jgi:hypothetical protein
MQLAITLAGPSLTGASTTACWCAPGSSDADVIAALQSTRTPEITVTLAGELTVIRFLDAFLDTLKKVRS